jgi:hypothetical protein
MENQLVSGTGSDGKQFLRLHLRSAPLRTHVPDKTPTWFKDYVKANDQWCHDAYKAIYDLYDAYNKRS